MVAPPCVMKQERPPGVERLWSGNRLFDFILVPRRGELEYFSMKAHSTLSFSPSDEARLDAEAVLFFLCRLRDTLT